MKFELVVRYIKKIQRRGIKSASNHGSIESSKKMSLFFLFRRKNKGRTFEIKPANLVSIGKKMPERNINGVRVLSTFELFDFRKKKIEVFDAAVESF